MADLILLVLGDDAIENGCFEDGDLENSKLIRCVDCAEAKTKAISLVKETKERIQLQVTPKGGGRMTVLDFDRESLDWIPAT